MVGEWGFLGNVGPPFLIKSGGRIATKRCSHFSCCSLSNISLPVVSISDLYSSVISILCYGQWILPSWQGGKHRTEVAPEDGSGSCANRLAASHGDLVRSMCEKQTQTCSSAEEDIVLETPSAKNVGYPNGSLPIITPRTDYVSIGSQGTLEEGDESVPYLISTTTDHDDSMAVDVFPLPRDDCDPTINNSLVDLIDNHSLVTSPYKACNKSTTFIPEGRRIVDVHHFMQALLQFPNHGTMGCNSSNMEIMKERREGLRSKFFIKCTLCGFKGTVETEPDSSSAMDANTSAVVGSVAVGIGHSQLNEILSTMDLPSMCFSFYKRLENNVGKNLSDTAWDEMKAAAEEEASIARDIGDVDVDGIPLIAVSADGSWAKRSYRTQYNSQSGMVSIKTLRKSCAFIPSNRCRHAFHTLRLRKAEYLEELTLDEDQRNALEQSTKDQSAVSLWKEERRKRITASNFGPVSRRKATTLCANLVRNLIYTKDFQNEGMKYGSLNESVAIKAFEESSGFSVVQSGLFVDPEKPFLGASPDGLVVGKDAIVEVKCPSSLKDNTPHEAIASKKFPFLNLVNGQITVNQHHKFYYQVQGELHITRRSKCFFILYTEVPPNIEVITISRDDDFWYKNMEAKLEQFYMDCILPELVDPRQSRSMPIREPGYILDARQIAAKKSKIKRAKKLRRTLKTNKCNVPT